MSIIYFDEFTTKYEGAHETQSFSKSKFSVQYQEQDPILLYGGNDNFITLALAMGWDLGGTRDGTSGAPYLISGYNITSTEGQQGCLIAIRDTDLYFEISGNYLNGIDPNEIYNDGIQFINLKNGIIRNNIICNSRNGITIGNSDSCIISNNTIFDIPEAGISLEGSGSNIITDNNLENCGLSVSGSTIEHYQQTEVRNNSLNGKSIIYMQHQSEVTVPAGAGQVILIDCSNITVTGQNLSFGSIGLLTAFSSDLSVKNNFISNTSGSGILFKNSNYNFVSNNSIHPFYEAHGIKLESSHDNIISNNDITNGTYFGSSLGIFLTGSNNLLFNNTIKYFMMGISVSSSNNSVINNTITHISHDGINLGSDNKAFYNTITYTGPYGSAGIKTDFDNNVVSYNTISNNFHDGINMDNAFNNTISNNFISNNSGNGISPDFTSHTFIRDNIIINNTENGIRVISRSDNTTILRNVIANNTLYGVSIENSGSPSDPPEFNFVSENHFMGNNLGGVSQAFDECPNNIFIYNYWEDWFAHSQNSDYDDYLDDPYPIEGASNNQDSYPLVSFPPSSTTTTTLPLSTTIDSSTSISTSDLTTSHINGFSLFIYLIIFVAAIISIKIEQRRSKFH